MARRGIRDRCPLCNDDGYVEHWDDEGDQILSTEDCPNLDDDDHPAFGASGIFDPTSRAEEANHGE